MPNKRKRSTARWLVGVAVIALLVGGAVAVADPDGPERPGGSIGRSAGAGVVVPAGAASPTGVRSKPTGSSGSTPATGPCGVASTQTIASVDTLVAQRIYHGELTGNEVGEDLAHIADSQELVGAVASSDQPAVYAAVHTIVYTPHWHIVRLQVLKGGRVLADVGGPDIIAPVFGTLRQNGVKVGSFVMSVQDDLGYVKLVTRFVGVPIDLYRSPPNPGSFVMGTLLPAPPPPSNGMSVRAKGASYLAQVIDAKAFPSGRLAATLFVPTTPRAVAAQSCATVRASAWQGILKHIAGRFAPLASHYQDYVGTVTGSTGGPVYVRVGSHQIAGLSAGPAHLPQHGTVFYRGRRWQVVSWSPYPPARIYFLAPPA